MKRKIQRLNKGKTKRRSGNTGKNTFRKKKKKREQENEGLTQGNTTSKRDQNVVKISALFEFDRTAQNSDVSLWSVCIKWIGSTPKYHDAILERAWVHASSGLSSQYLYLVRLWGIFFLLIFKNILLRAFSFIIFLTWSFYCRTLRRVFFM